MMTLTERINELNTLLKQDEFSVRLQERFKNNQVKRGLVLQSAKYNSSPILYMDDDFWNRPDEEIVEELRHCYEKHGCNIEVSDFLNREYLLQKVLPRVYSDDNIAQLKKNHIVYRHEMDLAFSFYIPVHSEIESELASITITDCLLENMDVDKDEMIEAAKRNLQAQIQFMDIREVMKSMGVPVPECNPDTDISMIAITNTSKINGAGVLLDASNFSLLVPELGNCFAILPSSIHECLCVPFQSESDLLTFAGMVKEINATAVALEDKLTDSVYIWKDGTISQFLN